MVRLLPHVKPVTGMPMIMRWISDVPSKMVKILAGMGRVVGIPLRPPDRPPPMGVMLLSWCCIRTPDRT